jgi:hypothetical protein
VTTSPSTKTIVTGASAAGALAILVAVAAAMIFYCRKKNINELSQPWVKMSGSCKYTYLIIRIESE